MADYPEWVMKHKRKGTYVNFANGKYYLYAAHSERVPGTKKVRRISDGYIGRITEEDGLIPARDKVSGEVAVYEYGLCMAALALCGDIGTGIRREFRRAADFVMVSGILMAVYGRCDRETFDQCYLCVKFPALDIDKDPPDKQKTGIARGERMVLDALLQKFGGCVAEARERLSKIYMVKINDRFYRSKMSDGTAQWLKIHEMELEG
jgi:hypothetical protein